MIRMFLNLSLRIKLFLAPSLIILAMLFLGATSYQTINRQNDALSFLYQTSLAKKDTVNELRVAVITANSGLYKVLNWQGIGVKEDKINGTPTFIINGKVYDKGEMTMPELDAAVALAKGDGKAAS